jgi:hypothetical protein
VAEVELVHALAGAERDDPVPGVRGLLQDGQAGDRREMAVLAEGRAHGLDVLDDKAADRAEGADVDRLVPQVLADVQPEDLGHLRQRCPGGEPVEAGEERRRRGVQAPGAPAAARQQRRHGRGERRPREAAAEERVLPGEAAGDAAPRDAEHQPALSVDHPLGPVDQATEDRPLALAEDADPVPLGDELRLLIARRRAGISRG